MTVIDAGINYRFVASHFAKAKQDLMQEQRTRQDVPGRILGVGLEGASRTGKTFDISSFTCQYINTYKGKRIIIGRDTLSALKDSAYKTLRDVWSRYGMSDAAFNKSATNIEYNGNQISFVGVNDNVERSKGAECELLWLNETLSIPPDIARQYRNRCNEFFLQDYNPAATKHWLYDMELRQDYRVLKTVIFDNPHAPRNSVKEILSYAHPDVDDYDFIKDKPFFQEKFKSRKEWEAFKEHNILLKTADVFEWKVYGLGMRAASQDLVFKDIYRYEEDPTDYDWKVYGGDFGYKTDPTAVCQIIKAGNRLYIKQLIYETGLLNNEIANLMISNGWIDEVSCWDAAEQKSVDEMIAIGVTGYAPPKAHIAWGIQKIQQFEIYIHVDSKDAYREFSEYVYLKKPNGEFKRNTLGHRIAKDDDNHTIDAVRYGLTYYYLDEAKETE